MVDDTKGKGADAAGGNLQDDAAGSGDVSFGSMLMEGFGGESKEESGTRKAEAVSGSIFAGVKAPAEARDEVSQISGLAPLAEFLKPQPEDQERVAVESGELTGFQARVLGRMKTLRDLRDDLIFKLRTEKDPILEKIDGELLNLNAFLKASGETHLEENSVIFDIGILQEMAKKRPEAPASAARVSDGPTRMVDSSSISAHMGEVPDEREALAIGGEIDEDLRESGVNLLDGEGEVEIIAGEGVSVVEETKSPLEGSIAQAAAESAGEAAPAPAAEPARAAGRFGTVAFRPGFDVRKGGGVEEGADKKADARPPPMPEDRWDEDSEDGRATVVAAERGAEDETMRVEVPRGKKGEAIVAAYEADFFGGRGLEQAAAAGDAPVKGGTVVLKVEPKAVREVHVGGLPAAREPEPIERGREEKSRFETQILGAAKIAAEAAEKEPRGLGIASTAAAGAGKGDLTRTQLFSQLGKGPEMEKIAEEGEGPSSAGVEDSPAATPEGPGAEEAEALAKTSYPHGQGAARGEELGKTRKEMVKPDFGPYGDIFYAVEKISLESGQKAAETMDAEEFKKALNEAIKRARVLASSGGRKWDSDTNPDSLRVGRLEKFKTDFFTVGKGADAPKRNFAEYVEWLKGRREECAKFGNVFEVLSNALAGDLKKENKVGVSPAEYGRIGLMRLCNAAIKGGELSEEEEKKVEALREMLEPKRVRGEKDAYAPEIAAEFTHEMVVGLATKRERAKARALEEELEKYRITVGDFRDKREKMVKVLVEVLKATRGAESDAQVAKERVREAIMELAPEDPLEREKFVKMIKDAQSGKGEAAKGLADEARGRLSAVAEMAALEGQRASLEGRAATPAASELSNTEIRERLLASTPRGAIRPLPQAVPAPRGHGPVARGIGNLITMTAGAAILAGGLWLGQNGILTIGSRQNAVQEAPVAAQVERVAAETAAEIPAGVNDAGKVIARSTVAAKKDAGIGAEAAPVTKPDAAISGDAGVDRVIKAVRAAQPPEEEAAAPAVEEYPRTKEGLKAALDDWCREGHGLLVSTEMLRAAYAVVEKGLDGKVLPAEEAWAKLMLKRKFPNRVIELSVMSDLARSKDIGQIELYASLVRLSVVLGDRAGNPKGFKTSVREANEKGLGLPLLDTESHVGKIENAKAGSRCLFAAYHETVMVRMAQIEKELLDAGVSEKEFNAKVAAALGNNSERILKLYKSANDQANQEERKDSCKTLTRGKRGSNALQRALDFVLPKWEAHREKVKREEKKYQESVDEVVGPAPSNIKNAPKPHNGTTQKTECDKYRTSAKDGGRDSRYYECINALDRKIQKEKAAKEKERGHGGGSGGSAGRKLMYMRL